MPRWSSARLGRFASERRKVAARIEVSDRTTLFDAWQKGARERQERAALEQEERVARERDEREDERRLAEFEAAQRAREQEALEGARGQLAELTSEFESLRARASEMQRNMDGIELPPGPALPEVNQNDTAAILAGLSGIETTIAGYRSRLNDSMLRYSRDRAAAEGRDEVLDWYGSFVATTPGATIGFANNEALAGREAQADELRRQAFERARDLMGTIEGRVVHVSEDLRQALEAVLNAPSHAGMRTAEAGLRLMVGRECERVDREQARRRSELERLQTDRVAGSHGGIAGADGLRRQQHLRIGVHGERTHHRLPPGSDGARTCGSTDHRPRDAAGDVERRQSRRFRCCARPDGRTGGAGQGGGCEVVRP